MDKLAADVAVTESDVEEVEGEEILVIEKVQLDMFTDLAKNTANVC
jgi:hypothetical protein